MDIKINHHLKKPTAGGLKKIMISLSLLILAATGWFWHYRGYESLTEARMVEILKRQVALNIVDIKLWEEINKEINWKKEILAEGAAKRNPFE